MSKLTIVSIALLFVGCAVTLDDVPVADKNQACVRQCAAVYSDCISRSMSGRFSQNACKESYKVCIGACPQR